MTIKQLKSIKDASAVASAIWKSKKHKITEKQASRLFLALKELNLIFIQKKMDNAKSQKELLSFIEYCVEHTDERFYQALRNWSGHNFILYSTHWELEMLNEKWAKKHKDFEYGDTFYI